MLFNQFEKLQATADLDWANDTIRVLLVRSTSTYAFDPDHDFLNDFTGNGGVEISVASYARQSLAGKTVNQDLTNDRMYYDANDVVFGALESGQTVKGVLIYRQVGGDDTTPNDDDLLYYSEGLVPLIAAAPASMGASVIYVDPLPDTLAIGDSIDIQGATADLTSAAARRARSLAIDSLSAAVDLADIGEAVRAASNLPFVLDGELVQFTLPTGGLIWHG